MDFTQFTLEELEATLKENKEKLTSMIMNRDLTKVIADIEVLEFMIKSRKEDEQKDTELN
jgi:hypothetical protein